MPNNSSPAAKYQSAANASAIRGQYGANFGGMLTINGAPVGRALGRYSFADRLERGSGDADGRGSVIIVIATDAPLDAFTLQTVAQRAALGLADRLI